MRDAMIFVGLMVAVVLLYIAWKLRGRSWREYFSTRDGKGILKGIIIAPGAILLIALVLSLLPSCAQAGTWLNDASVYAGLDFTHKRSPQCWANRIDDRGTSNLGFKLNLWQSDSKRVRVNTKYTHHSCALGPDDRQYDAVGLEIEWRVWER